MMVFAFELHIRKRVFNVGRTWNFDLGTNHYYAPFKFEHLHLRFHESFLLSPPDQLMSCKKNDLW
jgi:hypothetical protein